MLNYSSYYAESKETISVVRNTVLRAKRNYFEKIHKEIPSVYIWEMVQ